MGEENIIMGVNPILEALRADRSFERIYIASGRKGKPIQEILNLARSRGIEIRFESRERIEQIARRAQERERLYGSKEVEEYGGTDESPSHSRPSAPPPPHTQGVLGIASPYRYHSLEELWEEVQRKTEPPFIVLLDGIEDPHNLGAILRSAEGAGVHGIILPKRRSAGLTPTVVKTSAGALEYLPVCRVSNLASTLDRLKDYGLWIYGAVPKVGKAYYSVDLKGPVALVIGGESQGLKNLTLKKCDFLVSIPLYGKIASLNASVAAALLMFEVRQQREKKEVTR